MPGKYRWDKKYLYWGITAFIVIAGSIVFFLLLNKWPAIKPVLGTLWRALTPFMYGFVFAYLLNKVMNFFELSLTVRIGAKLYPSDQKKAAKCARVFAIIITMLCFLILVGGLCWLVLPQIYTSLRGLVMKSPDYYDSLVEWINQFFANNKALEEIIINMVGNISGAVSDWLEVTILPRADSIIANITSGVIGILREVLNILIGVVVSIYLLYHRETFCGQAKKITYGLFKTKFANRLLDDMRFIDKTCGGFITGKIIDSLIIGVICYISLAILRMPYSALVSVIVCLTNIIPVFGPFIGAIPSALLIMLDSPSKCLVFVIFIIILQQIDGNIIGPKILGNTVGLSGFWIMFAILFFGTIFGFWGMLLGVPILAMLYTAIKNKNATKLTSKALPTETEEFYRIVSVDPETNAPVYRSESDEVPTKSGERRRLKKTKAKASENDKKDT